MCMCCTSPVLTRRGVLPALENLTRSLMDELPRQSYGDPDVEDGMEEDENVEERQRKIEHAYRMHQEVLEDEGDLDQLGQEYTRIVELVEAGKEGGKGEEEEDNSDIDIEAEHTVVPDPWQRDRIEEEDMEEDEESSDAEPGTSALRR
eukprot:1051966-Rhodomonas_salina.4